MGHRTLGNYSYHSPAGSAIILPGKWSRGTVSQTQGDAYLMCMEADGDRKGQQQ